MNRKQKQQTRKSKRGGGMFDFLSGKKDVTQLKTDLANAEKKVEELKTEIANAEQTASGEPQTPVDAPAPAPAQPVEAPAPAFGGKTKKRRKSRK
jgi:hypothetical protein